MCKKGEINHNSSNKFFPKCANINIKLVQKGNPKDPQKVKKRAKKVVP